MPMLFGIAPNWNTGNKSTNMEMAKITDSLKNYLVQ